MVYINGYFIRCRDIILVIPVEIIASPDIDISVAGERIVAVQL